jgi:hypothetical protein
MREAAPDFAALHSGYRLWADRGLVFRPHVNHNSFF